MGIFWTLLIAGLVTVMIYRLVVVPGRTPALPSMPAISSGVVKTIGWIVAAALVVGLAWYFQIWTLATFSWADTTPGQAIDKWLGAGWSSWVMWTLVALVVIWILSIVLSKDKKAGGILKGLSWLALVAMFVIGLSAVMDWHRAQPQAYVPVELHTLKIGQSKTVPLGLTSIATIKIAGTKVTDGYRNYACPVAKDLQGVMEVTYEVPAGNNTSQPQVQLTAESKQKMIALNMALVNTTFTLTKGPIYGPTPCVNVRQ